MRTGASAGVVFAVSIAHSPGIYSRAVVIIWY